MHNSYISFLNNALYTKTRWRHTLPGAAVPKSVAAHPCSLCGQGLDEVRHYFGDCTVVLGAFNLLSPFITLTFELLYLQGAVSPALAELVVAFCQGLLITRRLATVGFASGNPSLRSRRLAKETTALLAKYFPKRPASKPKRSVPAEVRQALAAIPSSAITAYTDGSSFGNPGPSGAGACIRIPGLRAPEEFHLYEALGHGTNNLGELWALAMALQFLASHPLPPLIPIFIMSDSRVALAVPGNGKAVKNYPGISKLIQEGFAQIAHRTTLLWVPGHADIPGNDLADALAKMGSSKSKVASPSLPVFIRDCTYRLTYIPPPQD
jgi:ribonuclease HI